MAFVVADRVKETTTTVGTGAVALAGAVTGFRTFASGIGNSNTTYYTIASQSANEWEVGYGTLDATSANLARTTVLASSNGGSLVTFSAGTKDVFVTQSAARTLVQANGGTTTNGVLYYTGSGVATGGSALTFDGNQVSIGTGAAQSVNTINGGTTGGAVKGQRAGVNQWFVGDTAAALGSGTGLINFVYNNDPFIWSYAGSELMRLTSTSLYTASGINVGIGTSSPTAKLDVTGTAAISGAVTLSGGTASGVAYLNGSKVLTTGSALTFDGNTLGAIRQTAGIATSFGSAAVKTDFSVTHTGNGEAIWNAYPTSSPSTASAMAWQLGGTEQMRLTSTGLGIGTSSPAYKLDVQTSAGRFQVQNYGASSVLLYSNGALAYNAGTTRHEWQIAGTTFMQLDSSGNLGIGTSSPSYKLDVVTAGTSGARVTTAEYGQFVLTDGTRSMYLQNYVGLGSIGTSSNNALGFAINSVEKMRLDTSGNLGIGTSSPGAKLDVNGNVQIKGGGYELFLNSDNTNYYYLQNTGATGSANAKFEFVQGGVGTRLTLDSSGNLGLGATPSAWGSSGNIDLPAGSGISFGSAGGVIASNAYYNSGWKYKTSQYAVKYDQQQNAGAHYWYIAPSGTAGNAISFTQAMTLDASGNLLVGSTSAYRSGKVVVKAANVSQTSTLANLHVSTTDSQAADIGGSIGMGGQIGGDEVPLGLISGRKENSTSGNYAGYLAFATSASSAAVAERARISSTGGFSVGTAADPGAGAIYATGNITAYYSDDRLKNRLGSIENALDKIDQLSGFYYEANETAQQLGYTPKREVGVSAQDVQKVMPEIVSPAPIDPEYLTISYERLTPLLIEAIKELRAEVRALKK